MQISADAWSALAHLAQLAEECVSSLPGFPTGPMESYSPEMSSGGRSSLCVFRIVLKQKI